MSLKGRKALITGASRGIGRAVAVELARMGADLVVHYHSNRTDAEALAECLKQFGGEVFTLQADLENVDQAIALGTLAWESLGRLDILVNNAGVSYKKHFLDQTLADFDYFNSINFKSTVFLTQTVARLMVQHNIEGAIYSMTSVNAIQPGPGLSVYGATKGALESLMKGVALELAPHNIRVNTLVIGAVQTDMNSQVWQDPERFKAVSESIPMGRFGQPEEVAKVVCALLQSGTYVTGSSIKIDGGWLLKQTAGVVKKYGE